MLVQDNINWFCTLCSPPSLPKQFFCTQDDLDQDLRPKVTFKRNNFNIVKFFLYFYVLLQSKYTFEQKTAQKNMFKSTFEINPKVPLDKHFFRAHFFRDHMIMLPRRRDSHAILWSHFFTTQLCFDYQCCYCVCLNTRKGLQRNSEKPLWEQRKVF